ncbi:MAG: carboxypeptidase regulatory-like domain-containing protein [Bacteroidales bacterium]|nr:carboxypeptidase regulatory-like domain-containing protein [Bacteroidales bacterium]
MKAPKQFLFILAVIFLFGITAIGQKVSNSSNLKNNQSKQTIGLTAEKPVHNYNFYHQKTNQKLPLTPNTGDVVVIIDLDPTPNPELAPVIEDMLLDYQVEYVTDVNAYSLDADVEVVFLLLGIFSNNHVLTEDEAIIITSWLDTYGGNIYMEGGDTWSYDEPTSLHSYFNINGVGDGSGDLSVVTGIDSYWGAFDWNYEGENNWIDHLEAIAPAINVMENQAVGYYTGVAYDAGTYKSVGASHEITGLVGSSGNFEMAVACVIAYFVDCAWCYGNLEGYVTDSITGTGLENIVVSCIFGSEITGSNGYYIFEDILPGFWEFSVDAFGYYPKSDSALITNNLTSTLNFELVPMETATLEGYLTNASNGNPIEGALVELGIYSATTGADGYYFIGDIVPGTYDLFAISGGFCTFDTTLTFEPDQYITLNMALEYALLEIYADTLNISLYPNSSGYVNFSISNPGPCDHTFYIVGDVGWLGLPNTYSGNVSAGSIEEIAWLTSSYNLDPDIYEGNIIIYSFANSSPDSIHVMLEVLGYTPPGNLTGFVECTDICLNWEVPSTGSPLYYKIYRDGTLLSNFTGIELCDQNLDPEMEYCYQVTAVYVSGESEPTEELCITVPMPENLEPTDIYCTSGCIGNNIYWSTPEGCLSDYDGYNIYRDGVQLNTTPLLNEVYYDEEGIYSNTYEVTAIYFFGESVPAFTYCFFDNIVDLSQIKIDIYPNPVKDWFVIRSLEKIEQIEIFSNLGDLILTKTDFGKESVINLTGHNPGIYFIRIETAGAIINRKIVLQ